MSRMMHFVHEHSDNLGKAGTVVKGLTGFLDKDLADINNEGMLSLMNKSGSSNALKTIARDIIGRTSGNARVYDMIKQVKSFVQRAREMYVGGTTQAIYKQFKKLPTEAEWKALVISLGKTDLAALAQFMGVDAVIKLIKNPSEIRKRIQNLEDNLHRDPDTRNLMIDKAKQLASYMVTGKTGDNLLRNAYQIAHLEGEDIKGDGKNIDEIDQLVSLYAFEMTDNKALTKILKEEEEAIKYLLATMVGIRKDEASKGNKLGFKGSLPLKHKHTVKILNDKDAAKYVARGYVRVGDYKVSNKDSDRTKKGYYISTINDKAPFAQGIIQNVLDTTFGVDAHSGKSLSDGVQGDISRPEHLQRVKNIKENAEYGLIPIYIDHQLVGYERSVDPAVMEQAEPNNNLAEMLGVWRGRQVEENTASVFNEAVVDILDEEYKKAPLERRGEFINLLDPKQVAENPHVAEAVKILNKRAMGLARTKHGRLMVRRELVSNLIGYRTFSIREWFDSDSKRALEIQKLLHKMIGPKAYTYLVQMEDGWKGLVADAKQLIVVKSVVVPAINALSNIVHLIARGVPLQSIIRGVPRKLAEIEEYSQGTKRLIEIESDILAMEGKAAEIRALEAERMAIIEYHKTLSIWPLIESGEFTSIVSAKIDQEVGDLHKGKIAEYIEGKINKLEGGHKTFAKNIVMTRDTSIYQFLQKSVDYGDFVAKAIIYDDIITRGKRSKEHALGVVKEEFINYDYLPGRFRGYLESMGLLWFFNFKMRSIKIALSMVRENPLHMLAAVNAIPMDTPVGGLGIPIDDNMLYKLADGTLEYSVGPGMGLRSLGLHPLVNILQ